MCPCQLVRPAAFLITCCLYALAWPRVFFGEAGADAVIHKIEDGDVFNAKGLLVLAASLAVYWMVEAIQEALTHSDDIEWRSVLWSIGVIVLSIHALDRGWMLNSSALAFHASRAFWFGWIASNAANLVLQFRGQFASLLRRRPDAVQPISKPVTMPTPEPVSVPVYPAYEPQPQPQPVLRAHWRQFMQTTQTMEWHSETDDPWARAGQPFFLQSVNDETDAFLALPFAWQQKVVADDWGAMTWQEKASYLIAVKERNSQGRNGWLLPTRDQEGRISILEVGVTARFAQNRTLSSGQTGPGL